MTTSASDVVDALVQVLLDLDIVVPDIEIMATLAPIAHSQEPELTDEYLDGFIDEWVELAQPVDTSSHWSVPEGRATGLRGAQ